MHKIPSDAYKIQLEQSKLIYGFFNSPIGGFYIKHKDSELQNLDQGKFCDEIRSIADKSPILTQIVKNYKLEFKNDEVNSLICNRITQKNDKK